VSRGLLKRFPAPRRAFAARRSDHRSPLANLRVAQSGSGSRDTSVPSGPLRPDQIVRFLRLITSSKCRSDKRVSARARWCGVRAIAGRRPCHGVQWRRGRCPPSWSPKKQTADGVGICALKAGGVNAVAPAQLRTNTGVPRNATTAAAVSLCHHVLQGKKRPLRSRSGPFQTV
jgi:hypothetical protein